MFDVLLLLAVIAGLAWIVDKVQARFARLTPPHQSKPASPNTQRSEGRTPKLRSDWLRLSRRSKN